jgi:hypothetical protein
LSYGFAKELDHRNVERKAAGKPIPQDSFSKTLYRQPSLTDAAVYPEPYRNDGTYDVLRSAETGEQVVLADWHNKRKIRRGSLSINVHELTDEGEEDQRVLEEYFREVVLPLSKIPLEQRANEHDVDVAEQEHIGGFRAVTGEDEENQVPMIRTRERR